jgi:hypothetical protein
MTAAPDVWRVFDTISVGRQIRNLAELRPKKIELIFAPVPHPRAGAFFCLALPLSSCFEAKGKVTRFAPVRTFWKVAGRPPARRA